MSSIKLIFLLCFISISSCLAMSILPDVQRDLEMMTGRKISIAELSTVENYKYEAYNDIEFELYTQKNPEVHQRVLIDDPSSLHNSNFNPLHPTRILIHGCCTNGSSESIQYPRAGYMKKGEFNVFGVNWSKGAEIFPNFLTYGRRMKSTGEVVAQFIDFLIRDGNASMQDMGVIGHSAGAIVVSFVGTATNSTLAVQISLDPPKSLLFYIFGETHPQKTDAKYVEVMHTAAGRGSFFNDKPLGHADFYPNGGRYQPFCEDYEENQDHCNHMIAIGYFAESIASEEGFWAKRCKHFEGISNGKCDPEGSVTVYKKMGGEPVDTTEGMFYLKTADKYPFAQGWIS